MAHDVAILLLPQLRELLRDVALQHGRVVPYREVVEPERLVLTLSDQPGEDVHELITVVLTDLGDGRTEMLFQQRGRMSAEQYERAGQGWSSFFDRIAERLADA